MVKQTQWETDRGWGKNKDKSFEQWNAEESPDAPEKFGFLLGRFCRTIGFGNKLVGMSIVLACIVAGLIWWLSGTALYISLGVLAVMLIAMYSGAQE